MMQVAIGSIGAFTEKCVIGLEANRAKAEGWLERNAIIITALNPLIGYSQGSEIVKTSIKEDRTVREVAIERTIAGQLRHRNGDRNVSVDEVEAALRDMLTLTTGGVYL